MAKKGTDPRSRDAAQRVLQFDFTKGLFERNYRQLRVFLAHLQDPRVSLDLSGEESRWLRHEAMEEVVFLLHNFVAAAQSLVDHTRVAYRQLYEPDGLMPEYQAQIDARFVSDPLSQFVIGLRQMAQHYRLPSIRLSQTFTNAAGAGTMIVRLLLDVEDLKSFDSWNAPAKAFVAGSGKEIEISKLAQDYYNHVLEFHQWFESRQKHLHGIGPALYSRLTRHGLRSPEPEIVATIVANVDTLALQARGGVTYEELFAALAPGLTLMDQQALMLCQHDAACWVHEALAAVSKRFALPDTLRAKLLTLVAPPLT